MRGLDPRDNRHVFTVEKRRTGGRSRWVLVREATGAREDVSSEDSGKQAAQQLVRYPIRWEK